MREPRRWRSTPRSTDENDCRSGLGFEIGNHCPNEQRGHAEVDRHDSVPHRFVEAVNRATTDDSRRMHKAADRSYRRSTPCHCVLELRRGTEIDTDPDCRNSKTGSGFVGDRFRRFPMHVPDRTGRPIARGRGLRPIPDPPPVTITPLTGPEGTVPLIADPPEAHSIHTRIGHMATNLMDVVRPLHRCTPQEISRSLEVGTGAYGRGADAGFGSAELIREQAVVARGTGADARWSCRGDRLATSMPAWRVFADSLVTTGTLTAAPPVRPRREMVVIVHRPEAAGSPGGRVRLSSRSARERGVWGSERIAPFRRPHPDHA